jgi:hypothetical protein
MTTLSFTHATQTQEKRRVKMRELKELTVQLCITNSSSLMCNLYVPKPLPIMPHVKMKRASEEKKELEK